jgi:hypothetical protein
VIGASADHVAQVLAEQPALAGRVVEAEEVLMPLISPPLPRGNALGFELILEGFLLHRGSPRHVVDQVDPGAAVLAGDYCYAQGLVRIAATGDLAMVEALGDLVALSAAAVAAEREDDLLPLWRATAAALAGECGPGTSEAVRAARAALREGIPGPIHELAAALPPAPALEEALTR